MAATASSPDTRGPLERVSDDVLHLHVKVVPGASRPALAGAYGDRLKIRVTAPAESGKANRAVLALLAEVLDVPRRDVQLLRGGSTPLKTLRVEGVGRAQAAVRLGLEAL